MHQKIFKTFIEKFKNDANTFILFKNKMEYSEIDISNNFVRKTFYQLNKFKKISCDKRILLFSNDDRLM